MEKNRIKERYIVSLTKWTIDYREKSIFTLWGLWEENRGTHGRNNSIKPFRRY